MAKCTYCGKQAMLGRGVTYVDSMSSQIMHFCSHKCRMNFFQHRKKRKWALTLKQDKKIIAAPYSKAEETKKE
jgi:ribosomal protein L24E